MVCLVWRRKVLNKWAPRGLEAIACAIVGDRISLAAAFGDIWHGRPEGVCSDQRKLIPSKM